MSNKIKVNKDGKLVSGEELEFKPIKEDWNTYEASDGTIVKIKVVVAKIIKTEDRNPLTGDPGYTVVSQNVVSAVVSEKARE